MLRSEMMADRPLVASKSFSRERSFAPSHEGDEELVLALLRRTTTPSLDTARASRCPASILQR
jgi:hypothetical protein